MGAVKFYHLAQRRLDQAVLELLTAARGQGWRVMLRGQNLHVLEQLDRQLWESPADGFLPHGIEGGAQDADQPVLLGQGAAVNGAEAVLLLAGTPVDPEEAARMQRVWLLFEDSDPGQMQAARGEWKAVTAAGLVAEYWSDETGRWVKKAESGAQA